ncbi:DAZ-associated protein 2-like isoform X1 [Ptychodera flava]|uniref:DAZ-associated protein 2-like isoform X1 n=1 Tax=Ptychodera flava TaxID=63121 RepID=UPI00396AADC4
MSSEKDKSKQGLPPQQAQMPAGYAYPTQQPYPTHGGQYPQYAAPPPQYAYPQGPPPPYQQQQQPSPYPQAQPYPYQGHAHPQAQPQTVMVPGGFDAGARFGAGATANIPPPPPGTAPNAAQMAQMQGQNVQIGQRKGDWFSGGSDGGYTWW